MSKKETFGRLAQQGAEASQAPLLTTLTENTQASQDLQKALGALQAHIRADIQPRIIAIEALVEENRQTRTTLSTRDQELQQLRAGLKIIQERQKEAERRAIARQRQLEKLLTPKVQIGLIGSLKHRLNKLMSAITRQPEKSKKKWPKRPTSKATRNPPQKTSVKRSH